MHQVVPDVYLMEGLRGAHVYLLASDEGLTLVDSGGSSQADQVAAQLQEAGYTLADLKAIVLTHGHSDHTANAAELARRSGARIVAHRDEVPYIERTRSLPFGSLLQRLLFWLSDNVLKIPPCHVDEALEDGDMVEAPGGLQVIHVPGHTPGSIALYWPERQILFCGDALFYDNPLNGKPGLQPPPRFFSVDPDQARASVRRLADLPLQILCFGHGEPVLERASERLRELVG